MHMYIHVYYIHVHVHVSVGNVSSNVSKAHSILSSQEDGGEQHVLHVKYTQCHMLWPQEKRTAVQEQYEKEYIEVKYTYTHMCTFTFCCMYMYNVQCTLVCVFMYYSVYTRT